jgi:hypothetical protein
VFERIYRGTLLCLAVFSITFCISFSSASAGETPRTNDAKKTANKEAPSSNDKVNSTTDSEKYELRRFRVPSGSNDGAAQTASFLRLKPHPKSAKPDDRGVYLIEFSDTNTKDRMIKDSEYRARIAVEKFEEIDKSYFTNREASKEYKTDVSLGYKLSPYTEILLGRGFLMERKVNSNFEPRDNGWRFGFKANF